MDDKRCVAGVYLRGLGPEMRQVSLDDVLFFVAGARLGGDEACFPTVHDNYGRSS